MSDWTYTAEIDGQFITKGTNCNTVYRFAVVEGTRASYLRANLVSAIARCEANAARAQARYEDAIAQGFDIDFASWVGDNAKLVKRHQKALAALADFADNDVVWAKRSFHSEYELARKAAARVPHTLVRVVPVTLTKNY